MLYQGETLQLHWLDNGIAELVFNASGSVNKLDTRTVASLGEALTVLENQPELKGLLLRSPKPHLSSAPISPNSFLCSPRRLKSCTSGWYSPTTSLTGWKICRYRPFRPLTAMPRRRLRMHSGDRFPRRLTGCAHRPAGNQSGHHAGLRRFCPPATPAG